MTTEHFRAFNDDALRQFAADEQARAAEHGRRQAIHQSAAALARQEIKRRKRAAKQQRSKPNEWYEIKPYPKEGV